MEKIVFIGGSNAKNLSQAASMLGIDASMIASGGWKLTRENVDKLIPDLRELLGSLPPGTPIVLFCLDNSCFLAATEEGGMVRYLGVSLETAPSTSMEPWLWRLKGPYSTLLIS